MSQRITTRAASFRHRVSAHTHLRRSKLSRYVSTNLKIASHCTWRSVYNPHTLVSLGERNGFVTFKSPMGTRVPLLDLFRNSQMVAREVAVSLVRRRGCRARYTVVH